METNDIRQMKYIAYYHVLMVNNWESIVKEQLSLLRKSGLYDKLDAIKIGALGDDIDRLNKIIKRYAKCEIVRYSHDVHKYEFWTLKIAYHDAVNERSFYGLYFHTKGVSFPDNEGGKYWRDYMNHYNITQWKEAEKQLRKGYDTCGVKLLTEKDLPARKLHYSGNYFWFKSSYVARLQDPDTCNTRDRFQAEFWIGCAKPRAASLCQKFVDYNTKGRFQSSTNYVHTLCYNLTTEVEKTVKLLYDQNSNFEHYIVDLGFPLENDELNKYIDAVKKRNSERLRKIAQQYGSRYLAIDNVGVSQNWTAVYKHLDMKDDDVLIGADPDERPQTDDWVNAMSDVLRAGYGLVSLMMLDHIPILKNYKAIKVAKHSVLKSPGNINWALIGMSGKFLRGMKEVPYPKDAERYGYIESMIQPYFAKLNMPWAVLTEHTVRHTDYELGDEGTSALLREWKNLIIFQRKKYGQISLEEFIIRKIKKEL